jgi:hypothetical protein
MRIAAALSVGFAAVLLVGCAKMDTHSARMTKGEAAKTATALVGHEGVDLQRYQAPQVRYDSTQHKWYVLFNQKPPSDPGGYIFVEVDDRSGVGTRVPSH